VRSTGNWHGMCPVCKSDIGLLSWPGNKIVCRNCSDSFQSIEGIYQLISTDRLAKYEMFLDEYTRIRIAEGRGDHGNDYYQRLPEPSASDPLAWQWKIRNKSFRALLSALCLKSQKGKKIIDQGAGVGWLCNRLAEMGHHPLAIDINMDDMDGLSAGKNYDRRWPVIQAEFDNLPLADDQADVVIFNASLHYSTDYYNTLREALRVLANDGKLVIIDSPIYRKPGSGIQMKSQRHDFFEKKYGFRSDSINSIEFLTWDMIKDLGNSLGITWNVIRPWYGLGWAIRPLKATIKRTREPSTFAVLIAKRS